jgi:hypothetical protein
VFPHELQERRRVDRHRHDAEAHPGEALGEQAAATTLAALADLPARDRRPLLDTFGAWLDTGSVAANACSATRTRCAT